LFRSGATLVSAATYVSREARAGGRWREEGASLVVR
jgi:hypothetical protein